MKKLLTYLFIFSLLVYPILATNANVYEAKDFTEHPEQLVILEERDVVKLNWNNKEHKLMVRKVYFDKNKIDLTAFIEGAEVPSYATINLKSSLQLDFNQDLDYDMKVSIFNLLEDENIVALKLEKLEKEPVQIITTGAVIEKQTPNRFYQNKIFLFIGLILLSLVIWKRRFLLKTSRKIKK
ncbi:MAG: hypothetical protein ISS82_00420 [Nanoarchaeota archaeon]|nr:hypothetical protein [Nanoarchaeota archaeon]